MKGFYLAEEGSENKMDEILMKKLAIRWLKNNGDKKWKTEN